jgi:hypothetical protein
MIPFKPKAQAIPGDHPVPGMVAITNTPWTHKLMKLVIYCQCKLCVHI